ncbi:MAG: hypothetical protein RRC34_11100 [Lentisphaeria bacterium]|nr:hypothetical protein [Lentisphaeria bacterium]
MRQRHITILAALVFSVAWLVGPGSSGALLTDWTAGDVMSWSDPTGEPLVSGGGAAVAGADITEWFFRNTGGVYYFRMDLASPPHRR